MPHESGEGRGFAGVIHVAVEDEACVWVGGEDFFAMLAGEDGLVEADLGFVVFVGGAFGFQVGSNEVGGAAGEVDEGVEDASAMLVFGAVEFEGEVALREVLGDGEGGEESEVADIVPTAGVEGVWEVEAGVFEAVLEVGEVFGGADFADSEDVWLLGDDDVDEVFDFVGVFGAIFGFASLDDDLHGEVIFHIVGHEADGGGGIGGWGWRLGFGDGWGWKIGWITRFSGGRGIGGF